MITNHEPLCVKAAGTCICIDLGTALSAQYKKGWDDCTRFAAEQAKPLLRRNAMDTSRKAVERNADSIKGTQREVLDLLTKFPDGLTDFELESHTGVVHQSISAARRALVVAGLVMDSGERRVNLRGNDAAVWVMASPSRLEPDDRTSRPDSSPPDHSCVPTRPRSSDTCPACIAERGQRDLW